MKTIMTFIILLISVQTIRADTIVYELDKLLWNMSQVAPQKVARQNLAPQRVTFRKIATQKNKVRMKKPVSMPLFASRR